jgi:hypothetical protein
MGLIKCPEEVLEWHTYVTYAPTDDATTRVPALNNPKATRSAVFFKRSDTTISQ